MRFFNKDNATNTKSPWWLITADIARLRALERKAGFEPANSGVLKPAPNAGAFTSRLLSHMEPELGVKPSTRGV